MSSTKRVIKARSGLISSEPFFGSLATKLDRVEDPKAKSTWTDGKRLGFNPEWVNEIPMPELEATVAHHVLSCAWGHHLRRGNRDMAMWQEASDYIVNLELQRAGFKLPPGSLIDQRFDKMHVEAAYRLLEDERRKEEGDDEGDDQGQGSGEGQGQGSSGGQTAPQDQSGSSQGDPDGEGDQEGRGQPDKGSEGAGAGATGTCEDATDESGQAADDAEKAEQGAQWKEAAAQAAQIARGSGRLPGGIDRGITDFLNSKVDWREALQRLLKAKAKEDTSWVTASRRSNADFFMPGRKSIACGPLAFFVDASGSISQNEFNQAVSEIEEARTTMKPERVIVYVFDTQVRDGGRFEFGPDEPIEGIQIKAGGGTSFDDPIYELEREGVTPEVAIYLTDLDSRTFADEPDYPVVWISTRKTDAPYGDVILMDD